MSICGVEQLVGYNKPNLIELISKMAVSLLENLEEFAFVSNKIVQIAEKCYSSESSNLNLFLLYRCFAYFTARQFKEAKIMVQSLLVSLKYLGIENCITVDALYILGLSQKNLMQNKEAKETLEKCFIISRKTFVNRIRVGDIFFQLGSVNE